MQRVEWLNEIYTFLLSGLSCTERVEEFLEKRKIPKHNKYYDTAALPEAAESCIEKYGDRCFGVAGFYRSGGRAVWAFNDRNSILIPLRDHKGYIHTLKIRSLNPNAKSKYVFIATKKYDGGQGIYSSIHFPKIVDGNSYSTIRITEGEIKADVCNDMIDTASTITIAMGGITFYDDLRNTLEPLNLTPDKVKIALDRDVYDKSNVHQNNGFKMLGRIMYALKSLYRKVDDIVIETWGEEHGKGIDDVILGENSEHIVEQNIEEIWKTYKQAHGLPDNMVYLVNMQRFYLPAKNEDEIDEYWSYDQAGTLFQKQVKELKNITQEGIMVQTCASSVYDFNKPKVFKDTKGLLRYNMVNPLPDLQPSSENIDFFIEHLEWLYGSDYIHIITFCAFLLQNLGKKLMWALILNGAQGIGKSYLASQVLTPILGKQNTSQVNNNQFMGQYTSWYENKCLAVIDDLYIEPKNQLTTMNKIKPIITERVVSCRRMYCDPYEIRNTINLLITTNFSDAVELSNDDRRFCFISSNKTKRDGVYYNELHKKTAERLYAVKEYLMSYDLSDFDPHAPAPMTQHKINISSAHADDSLDGLACEIHDEKSYIISADIILLEELKQVLENKKLLPNKRLNLSLATLGCDKLSNQILFNGSQRRWWVVRNHEMYKTGGQYDKEKITKYIEETYKDVSNARNMLGELEFKKRSANENKKNLQNIDEQDEEVF